MAFDLIILSLIGAILEALCTKFAGLALGGAPTMTISLLICFLAVIRWNFWGMLVIPIMALSTIIGGNMSEFVTIREFYDYKVYLCIAISLLPIGLNGIVFKIKGTKKIVSNTWISLLMILVSYAVSCGLFILCYRLFTTGTLTSAGHFEYDGTSYMFGENEYIYNLFSLAAAAVGFIILRSQGATTNAIEKLIEDKEEAELNARDRFFRIEENEEEPNTAKEDSLDTEESTKN